MLQATQNAIKIEAQSWLDSDGPLAKQAWKVPEMVDEIVAPVGRICKSCKEWKDATRFHARKTRASNAHGGLREICNACKNAIQKKARVSNLEHFRKIEAESRERRAPFTGEKRLLRNRGYALKSKFGITLDAYIYMLESQDMKCAICSAAIKAAVYGNGKGAVDSACVDHDHETGRVRALLCNPCNRGLGSFQDKIDLVEKALNYLRSHKQNVR